MGMTTETRALACAGLSPHEAATVRLVSNSLAERLLAQWRLVNEGEADVVVADPSTEAGRAAVELAPRSTDVIALIDRNGSGDPPTSRYLFRPLRPAALVELLNQSGTDAGTGNGTGAAEHQPGADTDASLSDLATGVPRVFREALRTAMRDAPIGSIDVIDGPAGELAIDIERDRLLGPVHTIDAAALTDATAYPVYRVHAALARARNSQAHEMPLTIGLWRLLSDIEPDIALFGSPDRSAVWLTRWPKLPSKRMPRRHLRAATALRHAPRTPSALARALGIDTAEVLGLCNGAWLMGDLEVAETLAPEAQCAEAASTASRSLASRIRQRLGVT